MQNKTIKKLIEKLGQAKEYKEFNIININYVIECLNFERDRNNLNARHISGIKGLKKPVCFSVNSKDLFNKKKNPGLKLSVESILKNRKIKKTRLKGGIRK